MSKFVDEAKAVFRGKGIALNAYLRQEEISKVNDQSFLLKNIGKKSKQTKSKYKEGANDNKSRN